MDRLPSSQDEWRDLHETVKTYANRLTKSPARADNLTQEAFARLFTTRRWDPAAEPSLPAHIMKIVKSLLSHERTSRRADYESRAADEHHALGGAVSPSPEQRALEASETRERRAHAERCIAALRQRLAGHELELRLIDLTFEGIDRRADQAAATGRPITEVYEAWRRINRFKARIDAGALHDEGREEEEVVG